MISASFLASVLVSVARCGRGYVPQLWQPSLLFGGHVFAAGVGVGDILWGYSDRHDHDAAPATQGFSQQPLVQDT